MDMPTPAPPDDPEGQPPDPEAVSEPEPPPEAVAEPEPAAPPPRESGEELLARENAELREYIRRTQQHPASPVAPAPPPDPLAGQDLTPEEQQAWRRSLGVLMPIMRSVVAEAMQPIVQRAATTETMSERALMYHHYPEFASDEAETLALRAEWERQLGFRLPLAGVYLAVLGDKVLKQRRQSARGQQRRHVAARAAVPETAAPVGRVPAPTERTKEERLLGMSDEEFLETMARERGIARMVRPKRRA